MQIVFSDVLIRYLILIIVCMELSRYLTGKSSRNGDKEIRTLDPLLARQVLSQLSYVPICIYYNQVLVDYMGLSGLEPPTSRLSGVRSNQLSYKPKIRQPPALPRRPQRSTIGRHGLNHRVRDVYGCSPAAHRHRTILTYPR